MFWYFFFLFLRQNIINDGAETIVINQEEKEPKEELMEDLITIVSHFARKIYGMKSHKYKEVVENTRRFLQDS